MERFVKLTAPTGKVDFVFKLFVFLLIGGTLNHTRDFLTHGPSGRNTFLGNFIDASWTAVPMCIFALLLIGHLNALQRQLYQQATTDTLTQLRNRRWFMKRAGQVGAGKHALLMLDVDFFKNVNDTYGHESGDVCLQVVARHIRSCLRPGDLCARFGGEEFAVLLKNANAEIVDQIATSLCRGVRYAPTHGSSQQVTMSAGAAYVARGILLSSVLRQADHALYDAKKNGRARYAFASDQDSLPVQGEAVTHTQLSPLTI